MTMTVQTSQQLKSHPDPCSLVIQCREVNGDGGSTLSDEDLLIFFGAFRIGLSRKACIRLYCPVFVPRCLS